MVAKDEIVGIGYWCDGEPEHVFESLGAGVREFYNEDLLIATLVAANETDADVIRDFLANLPWGQGFQISMRDGGSMGVGERIVDEKFNWIHDNGDVYPVELKIEVDE